MQCIFTRKALPAFIACVLSSAAAGGSFTNHVGRSVSGQLTSITNGVAVIGSRSYPLSIFPASEQARMRELLQTPKPLTPDLAALQRSHRERLLRNEALLKAGAKTKEESDALRAKLESAWRRALDASGLDDKTRAYWIEHHESEPAKKSPEPPKKIETNNSFPISANIV